MNTNGPSVHLLNDIIASTKKAGNEVVRIERKYGQNTWKKTIEKIDGSSVIRFESSDTKSVSNAKRYINDIKYAYYCWKEFRKSHFDYVFLQSCNTAGFHAFWIKHSIKCALVFNVQDIFPEDTVYEGVLKRSGILYKTFQIEQNYAYRYSNFIITISEDMKKTLIDSGVSEEKVKVIYNWQYQNQWNEADSLAVKETLFNDEKFHVVYAGNIGNAQGVDTLIKAGKLLEMYKDIVIDIIGNGSKKSDCINLAKKQGSSNIIFHELLPQNLSRYIYEQADINIVTLISGIIRTSLPSKTASCFNSGKPVIYCVESDSITINKLQKASSLVSQCDPGDESMLANRIIEIYKQRPLTENITCYNDVLIPQSPDCYAEVFTND